MAFVWRTTAVDRAELEGVRADRSPRPVAGAPIAEASMRALSVESPQTCPLVPKEGLMLRKLDTDGDLVGSSI